MKHVLYEDIQGWAITPENNYYPMIGDANKITHFSKHDFKDREAVLDYIINILKLRHDMLIIEAPRRY